MKILICDPVDEKSIEEMKAIPGAEVDVKTGMTPDELKACVGDYNIMVVRSATKAKADVLEFCKNMKLILRGGVGMDNIDQVKAAEMGIKVDLMRAGKANMFQSEIFSEAIANSTGATVELYNTDGAQGAARGAGVGAKVFNSFEEAFSGLKKLKVVEPEEELMDKYEEAYSTWKEKLVLLIDK